LEARFENIGKLLVAILDYNEDDCIAMRVLLDGIPKLLFIKSI